MCHVAVFVVCVFIILMYIVDEMIAAIVRIGQRKVIVVNARHLVAVVIDEAGIIDEIIEVEIFIYNAVAVESLHVSHLVVIIKGIIIVNSRAIESGG